MMPTVDISDIFYFAVRGIGGGLRPGRLVFVIKD